MDNDNKYIHDAYMSMAERTMKRQWITIILLIILLVGTYLAWFVYDSQFVDEQTTTVTQDLDSDGGNAIINDGVHINGTSETNDNYN